MEEKPTVFVVDDDPGGHCDTLSWAAASGCIFRSARSLPGASSSMRISRANRVAWCATCGCRKWTASRCSRSSASARFDLPIIFRYGLRRRDHLCRACSAAARRFSPETGQRNGARWSASQKSHHGGGAAPRQDRFSILASNPRFAEDTITFLHKPTIVLCIAGIARIGYPALLSCAWASTARGHGGRKHFQSPAAVSCPGPSDVANRRRRATTASRLR